MIRRKTEAEYRQIVKLVERFPDGASIDDINSLMKVHISRRTLQRRLRELTDSDRIRALGDRKGRRYTPVFRLPETRITSGADDAPADEPVFLTPESQEIKAYLSVPVSHRNPVGYNILFLDEYQPNKTFYLTSSIRERLRSIGKQTDEILPAGTFVRKIYDRLLIDLSWNSSRLEGNTYSLLDTERLLKLGESSEDNTVEETQMILNHKAAIEMLSSQADEIGFNSYTIRNLHAVLSNNLLKRPEDGGRLRSVGVGISASVSVPLEIPQRIEEYFVSLLQKAEAISDPFEQAFFILVQLPYLQPFVDVNKRVSRLAANIPLFKQNLCPLSFTDLDKLHYTTGLLGVYELNRIEYLRDAFVWSYERSCAQYSAVRESLGEPDPFRLKYRSEIKKVVSEVVRSVSEQSDSDEILEPFVNDIIPIRDRQQFRRVVYEELSGLHEGNIARYAIRPSEFDDWIETR